MKTKNLVAIISAMIFAAAILLGIAVIAILLLAPKPSDDSAVNIAENPDNRSAELAASEAFTHLYDGTENRLLRISLSDGREQVFDLGLDSATIYISGKAFTSDGRLMALCTVERIGENSVISRFIVRNLEAGTNLIEENLGEIPACRPSAFSPDNTRLAVGFVFNSLIDGQVRFPEEPNWALRIYDVNTNTVVQEIGAESPNAPDFESMSEFWFEPNISPMVTVMHYGQDSIYFLAYPFVGRDGPPAAPAFRWDLATSELSQIDNLGNNGATFLAQTGEIAYPYLNEVFPVAQPMGPIARANEVRITDASGTRTIYRDTQNVIATVSFVNGGRQLALLLIPSYDAASDTASPSRYILVNRDGTIENLNSASIYTNSLIPTADGFAVLTVEQRPEGNIHNLLRYQNGQTIRIWSNEAQQAMPPVWLENAWSSPMPIAENLSPFVAIN